MERGTRTYVGTERECHGEARALSEAHNKYCKQHGRIE